MKLELLAKTAAELAEEGGWSFVTARGIARRLKVNPVSVSRSAGFFEIIEAAQAVVGREAEAHPRAAVELQLGALSRAQRLKVLAAVGEEMKS